MLRCCCGSVCLSVRLSLGLSGFVGAGYSCQSRAEEATFSSFSRDLLALYNRSELLLPGSRPSMLTKTLPDSLQLQSS